MNFTANRRSKKKKKKNVKWVSPQQRCAYPGHHPHRQHLDDGACALLHGDDSHRLECGPSVRTFREHQNKGARPAFTMHRLARGQRYGGGRAHICRVLSSFSSIITPKVQWALSFFFEHYAQNYFILLTEQGVHGMQRATVGGNGFLWLVHTLRKEGRRETAGLRHGPKH